MVGTFTYIGKNTKQLTVGEIYQLDLLDVSRCCYESKSPVLIRKAKNILKKERCSYYHNPNYGIGIVVVKANYSYIYRSWSSFLRDWKEDD